MLLSSELIEITRPHPHGQRSRLPQVFTPNIAKKVHW
jgi:hypothetical protein